MPDHSTRAIAAATAASHKSRSGTRRHPPGSHRHPRTTPPIAASPPTGRSHPANHPWTCAAGQTPQPDCPARSQPASNATPARFIGSYQRVGCHAKGSSFLFAGDWLERTTALPLRDGCASCIQHRKYCDVYIDSRRRTTCRSQLAWPPPSPAQVPRSSAPRSATACSPPTPRSRARSAPPWSDQ
jgi:hypothetical protein